MSGGTITRRFKGPRNSLDAEREEFLRQMAVAMSKAINKEECAVKEKHLRITILGTHKEQGANYFWDNVLRLQIEGHPIIAWKFCHVFHKVMREGHLNVLKDSAKYKTKLKELGKYWGHLKDDYGTLILHYCKLVLTKLEFHSRNPEIPGNLVLSDAAIVALGDGDVNNLFQIAIEALDYQDEILALQRKVFDSMDMGRANSLTNMGQCRLAPLILCIQDSSCLYDYLVKILFYLHARCPKDTLSGHRERFNGQFKALKQFFYTSSNLQYFKHLVSIPPLPELPPNFMNASEFESYVPFRVTVHGHEEDRESISSEGVLVDFAAPVSPPPTPSPRPVETMPTQSASNGRDDIYEKEAIITSLRHDLDDTKALLQRLRNEYTGSLEQAQNRALQLEHELSAVKDESRDVIEENERYRSQAALLQNENNSQTARQLEESEKKAASNEDKFKKMKDVYSKLREEHIGVLSKLGTLQKETEGAKKEAADAADAVRASSHRLEALSLEKDQLLGASSEAAALRERLSLFQRDGDSVLRQCQDMIKGAVEEGDDPAQLSVGCSPEFVLSLTHSIKSRLNEGDGGSVPVHFLHQISHLLSFLKATANAAPTGKGAALLQSHSALADASLDYLGKKKDGQSATLERVNEEVVKVEEQVQGLLGRMGDVDKDKIGGMMDQVENDSFVEGSFAMTWIVDDFVGRYDVSPNYILHNVIVEFHRCE